VERRRTPNIVFVEKDFLCESSTTKPPKLDLKTIILLVVPLSRMYIIPVYRSSTHLFELLNFLEFRVRNDNTRTKDV